MKILVTGSTGFIGSALAGFFTTRGDHVTRVVRRKARAGESEIQWNGIDWVNNIGQFDGHDAAVHLSGENIAAGRWTAPRKAKLRSSRVDSTRLLAETLSRLTSPPRVLVSASAVGFYGDRGDEVLDEMNGSGKGFLAGLCREWEDASLAAAQKGIRVVHLRIGVVLSAAGGALPKMLTPFRLGAGGIVGSGKQFMSWIALEDLLGSFHHAIVTDALAGAVNAVAPDQVTNKEFTRTLGRVLGRPTILPLPAFAAQLLFGEMADELFLASQRVTPRKLVESGFVFRLPTLEGALRHTLGRGAR